MKQYGYCKDAAALAAVSGGVMLRSDDRLKDSVVSRASLQKLLLSPEADIGLEKQFENTQTQLWINLFRQCAEHEVVVRLPDMLFDCLLPQNDAEFACIAEMFQCPEEALRGEAERLTMCHQLCCCQEYHFPPQYLRLFELQIRSIMQGAERGGLHKIALLLPYSGNVDEVRMLCGLTDGIAAEFLITCQLGIEVSTPRAACETREYAGLMDFLVFNTEALTQKMYGIPADGAEDAVEYYMQRGVFEQSPFCSFDETGLGTLLLLAIERARAIPARIRIGMMGKPVCEPVGQAFCRENKVDMLFT
ncbi:putative PEP-binding protein [Agathobaculum sp.]|uniref:putative PEP-binding protein n=1 Tax=Agathobaculum sp. TaxID=2048138 RepID=UPI002A8226FF|nr:putative PEP-binding protein [Agathobaculum sp.]MDY3619068.1 putative PEP-binding protein [Agathobaculum sp.]